MKKFAAVICLFFAVSSHAFASAPSDASLNQLMAITDMKQMINAMFAQFDGMMNSFVQQSMKGQQVRASEQKAIDNMKSKMVALLKSEYDWEVLEPKFLQIYKTSFTQEEVDGMIAFYKTPAGQAVIKKMPVVMQQSMVVSQSMIQALLPKMQKIQQAFIAEMKVAE